MHGLMDALGATLFFAGMTQRKTVLHRSWFLYPLLLFWVAYSVRIAYSTGTEAISLARPPIDYWLWAIGGCLVPMLGLLTQQTSRAWKLARRSSMALSLFAAVVVSAYGTTYVQSANGPAYDSGRLRLVSLNPISVGHLGVSLFLISLWPILFIRDRLGGWQRIGIGAGVLLGLYLTVAAASRGPIVALIFVLLSYVAAFNPKRAWKVVILLCMVLAVGYVVAAHFQKAGDFDTLSRIAGALSGNDSAVALREKSLTGAVSQFLDSPLIGDSLEVRSTHFYPHNVIIESLMATGIVGGIPFILVIIAGLRAAYRVVQTRSENGWVALLFIQYLVAAQFSGALYSVTPFWAFLGATISLSTACRKSCIGEMRVGSDSKTG
jgi:hypothetical protein